MIAIDLVGTSLNSGSKTYNINFYKYFSKENFNKKILIFISKSYLPNLKLTNNKNIRLIIRPNYFNNFLIRIIWMQLILPLELKIYKVTKLYSPMNYSPLIIKFLNIKSILYVHTILPWVYFNLSPGNIIKKLIIKKLMEKSIINSEIVMVPSIYAKDKIVELLKINKDKVEVNYLGIDQNFIDNKKSNYYLKNFNYQNNYILSVLSCARYHNILNLLSAFKKFKLENNTDIKLVLVLSILDGGYYMKIKNFLNMNFDKNEIIILSNIENYYLVNLYRHSKLYIFTSYNEVFGFTSLEAMSQETPVLVSKNSALTEVNRDAVEYFDPDNILQIKDKIKQLVFDETIKKELVNKGKIHFKKFNWNNHIKNFLKLI